jgi:hypothetical protein
MGPLFGLLYQPRMIGDDECGAVGGMRIGMGNRSTRRKPVPSATLSTINPVWPDSGSTPGCRGGKPAINRLSYGAALSNSPSVAWCYSVTRVVRFSLLLVNRMDAYRVTPFRLVASSVKPQKHTPRREEFQLKKTDVSSENHCSWEACSRSGGVRPNLSHAITP